MTECLSCYRMALDVAADRLSDQFTESEWFEFGNSTEELAINLMETGQVTCPACARASELVLIAG